jgi:hypothetical protein
MEATANLSGVHSIHGLCFVRAPWAYFTRLPLAQQWGDRWEIASCKGPAGAPYSDSPDQILTVAFDGPLLMPDKAYDGRLRSVMEINCGKVPWLRTHGFGDVAPIQIMAGATLESFVKSVELAGGHVFAPFAWGALRLEPSTPQVSA